MACEFIFNHSKEVVHRHGSLYRVREEDGVVHVKVPGRFPLAMMAVGIGPIVVAPLLAFGAVLISGEDDPLPLSPTVLVSLGLGFGVFIAIITVAMMYAVYMGQAQKGPIITVEPDVVTGRHGSAKIPRDRVNGVICIQGKTRTEADAARTAPQWLTQIVVHHTDDDGHDAQAVLMTISGARRHWQRIAHSLAGTLGVDVQTLRVPRHLCPRNDDPRLVSTSMFG